MSLLQIGLNGVSLARGKMDEACEKMAAPKKLGKVISSTSA